SFFSSSPFSPRLTRRAPLVATSFAPLGEQQATGEQQREHAVERDGGPQQAPNGSATDPEVSEVERCQQVVQEQRSKSRRVSVERLNPRPPGQSKREEREPGYATQRYSRAENVFAQQQPGQNRRIDHQSEACGRFNSSRPAGAPVHRPF